MRLRNLLLGGLLQVSAYVILISPLTRSENGGDDVRENAIAGAAVGKSSGGGQTLWDNPANAGAQSQAVNLYTGQHVESFPLMSLPGRGEFGVSLTLDYNGNVFLQAKQESYKVQASPFGLGFSLGGQSIIVDHRSTADVSDDDYRLVLDNSAMALYEKPGYPDLYVTETGEPWSIERQRGSVDGIECVIGWTIKQADGTVYHFGDGTSNPLSWNATRNVLRYGTFVGAGIAPGDHAYPTQWDLKAINDTDSLHWIHFDYFRDQRNLQVGHSGGTITNSDHTYTGSTYLRSVTTDDERSLYLHYSAREDAEPVFGYNNYEFYLSQKCDSIVELSPVNIPVSKIKLSYSYLNADLYPDLHYPFKKLLLVAVERWSLDGNSAQLPSLTFEYYTDPGDRGYGALHRVNYPSGPIREILYDTLASGKNFARLDIQALDQATSPNPFWSSNKIYVTHLEGSTNWVVGIWDGYWKVDTVTCSSIMNDRPGILHNDIVVIPMSNNDLLIRDWRNGFWQDTVLEASFARYSDVFVYPGDGCFLLVTGTWSIETGTLYRRSYYYRFDGNEWHHNEFYSLPDWEDLLKVAGGGIRLRNDIALVSLFKDCGGNDCYDSRVLYGHWDSTAHLMPSSMAESYDTIGGNVFVGHDYVGWTTKFTFFAHYWSNNQWIQMSRNVAGRPINALSELSNGVVWNRANEYDQKLSWFYAYIPDSSILHQQHAVDPIETENAAVSAIWTSNNALAAWLPGIQGGIVGFYKWSGNAWVWSFNIASGGPDMSESTIDLRDYSYVYGPAPGRDFSSTLVARHWVPGWGWRENLPPMLTLTDLDLSSRARDGFSASDDYLLCHRDASIYLYKYDLFNHGYAYMPVSIHPLGNYYQMRSGFHSERDYFAIWPRKFPLECIQLPLISCDSTDFAFVYKWYDTLFAGDAPYPVVSSISIKQYESDPSPTVVNFDYDGGLLDRSGSTPRFARVRQSSPHFAGAVADGWTVHCFYNDIDTLDFYDIAVYDGKNFPDLKPANRYGIANGGFRLDGTEYLTYSYSGMSEPVSGKLDSVQSFHSLYAPTGYPTNVYRTKLDSVNTYQDSLSSHVEYDYDLMNHQVVKTRTRYIDAFSYLQDEAVYAYTLPEYNGMVTDNALVQVAEQIRSVHHGGQDTLLSKAKTEYVRNGSWVPASSYSYRTLNPSPSDSVYSFSLLPGEASFDARGNIVVAYGPNGIVSSTKFDSEGNWPVATSTGCRPTQFLYQGFEQGDQWDGWALNTFRPDVELDDTQRLAGKTSLYLHDLNVVDNGKVWGPERIVIADSIKDSLYNLSYWIKANDAAFVHLWVYDNTGYQQYYWSLDYQPAMPANNVGWKLVQKVFNIPRNFAGGRTLGRVELHVGMFNAHTDTNYAYVDEIRFHPVSAVVRTSVNDPITGKVIASAGADNFPIVISYDQFRRPVASFSPYGDSLTHTEYRASLSGSALSAAASGVEVDSHAVVIRYPQSVSYELSTFSSAKGKVVVARVFKNSLLIQELECDGHLDLCEEFVQGSFEAVNLDTVSVVVRSFHVGASGSATASILTPQGYNPSIPAQVKTTTFRYTPSANSAVAVTSRTVTIAYYDAYGRALQTRTLDSVGGVERAVVSGPKTYDSRGRTLRSYLPYIDTVGQTGVGDFSTFSAAVAECNAYYDGDPGRGANCQGYPFAEVDYADDIDSKIDSSGAPGNDMRFGSTHSSKSASGNVISDPTGPYFMSESIDPDGLRSIALSDQWGRWSKQISPYSSGGGVDSVTLKTVNSLSERKTAVYVDTGQGAPDILLRSSARNVLGLDTSTLKVDYGTIRMLYDKAGNLRFMQNQIRRDSNQTVYFRYDQLGRKTEEGIASSTYFTQTSADDPSSPATPLRVAYKWIYDYYQSGSLILSAPGKLVRLRNADSTYYRNFTYSPAGEWDEVVVKLPQGANAKKKLIKHFYSRDGKLQKLAVYPDSTNSATARFFSYHYDQIGRLEFIRRSSLSGTVWDTLNYIAYRYNPDGSYRKVVFGGFDFASDDIPPITTHDTVQVVDYWYTPEGRLDRMNQLTDVVSTESGTDKHVGTEFQYHPVNDPKRYFNGRVRVGSTANSSASSSVRHAWKYEYNDLSWLTKALDTLNGTSFDQEYSYNALGHRMRLVSGGWTTDYTYSSSPGSSKLITLTGSSQPRTFDTLGNLTSDPFRGVYSLIYDYRNLLVNSYSAPNLQGAPNTNVVCIYDETGQRIKKGYSYSFYAECPPPPPFEGLMGGESELQVSETNDTLPPIPSSLESELSTGAGTESSVGGQCLYTSAAATYYLYDGGVLLATFDHNDAVVDLFVNGPTGRIASYYQNNANQLYYFLTDQVGSTRIVMKGSPGQTYQMAEYYNYQPFGEVIQSWGNYPTSFKFSSKEHDKHGGFDFHYFGSRYYDPRIGQFASIDAAGQFASGYLYGGNNPISTIDPDGNFAWFVPLLLGAVVNTAMNSNSIHNFGDFAKFAGIGAYSASLGAGVGNMIGNAVKVGGFIGGAASGAAGGFAGGFSSGAGNAWVTNSNFREGLVSGLKGGTFGAASGAALGGIIGGVDAKLKGGDFWNGKAYLNEVGGSSGGVQLDETIPPGGKPTKTGEIARTRSNPKYGQYGPDVRNGGLKAHNGVDYAGKVGDDVYAMYDGRVSRIWKAEKLGEHALRTNATINGKQWYVDYGHMSKELVKLNDVFVTGDRVGLMGRSGIDKAFPTHVHIQVWRYIEKNVQGFVMPSWKEY